MSTTSLRGRFPLVSPIRLAGPFYMRSRATAAADVKTRSTMREIRGTVEQGNSGKRSMNSQFQAVISRIDSRKGPSIYDVRTEGGGGLAQKKM